MQNKKQAIMSSSSEIIAKIKNKEVNFELSKRGLKNEINFLYLYEKKPVGKIVLGLQIKQQFYENPLKFYDKHGDKLGYDKQTFEKLYGSYEKIHFYYFENYVEYLEPKTLQDLNKKSAPQSIQYVELKKENDNK